MSPPSNSAAKSFSPAAKRARDAAKKAEKAKWAAAPPFPVASNPALFSKAIARAVWYSATTDLADVERSFRRRPEALIAVPMGRRTGLFAIDVDASPPHAHDGVAAVRALEDKHGALVTRTTGP